MKEALGAARNITLVSNDEGNLNPMVEVVVIYTEPRFRLGKEALERVRVSGTLRFVACPDALRGLAVQFAEWADQADKLATTYQHDVQGMATEDGACGDRGAVQHPGQ